MLYLVPLRRAGRKVTDLKRQAGLVGQFLQFDLEQPHTRTVRTAAIGGDHQAVGIRIPLAAHHMEPAADRIDRELRRVVVDADTHATGVGGDVVDAVRHHLAVFGIDEIMHTDQIGIALRPIVAANVLVWTDQLLLLGVDRDNRLTGRLVCQHGGVDVLELRIAIGVAAAFEGLAVDLPTVAQQRQQLGNAALADPVSLGTQRVRQLRVALGHPQQRAHWIAHCRRFQQPPQIVEQRGILGGQRMPPAAGAPDHTGQRPRVIEVLEAATNRAACNAGGARRGRDPTVPGRSRFRRRKQPSAAFVQTATNRTIPFANRRLIHHAQTLRRHLTAPESSKSNRTTTQLPDSRNFGRRLSGSIGR